MNDRDISAKESTPFFDKLVVERGAQELFHLPWNYGVSSQEALKAASTAPEQIVKAMEVVTPVVPQIEENVHPMDLDKMNVTPQEFVFELERRFAKKYPKVVLADVMTREELDGTVTVIIRAHPNPVVQTDEAVNAAPTNPILVKSLPEALKADIEQETIDGTQHSTEPIPVAKVMEEFIGDLSRTGSPFDRARRGIESLRGSSESVEVMLRNQKTLQDLVPTEEVPMDIEKFDIQGFIRQSMDNVRRDNPGAVITDVSFEMTDDGGGRMIIDGLAPSPVQKKVAEILKNDAELDQDPTKLYDLFGGEVKDDVEHIGEDTAESLYMKTGPWGENEE